MVSETSNNTITQTVSLSTIANDSSTSLIETETNLKPTQVQAITKYKTSMDSNNFYRDNHWYYPNKNTEKILETYKPPSKYDRVPAMSKGSRRLLGYNLNSILPARRNFDFSRPQIKNDTQIVHKRNKFYLDDDDDEDDEYVMVYDSSKVNLIPSSSSSSSTTTHPKTSINSSKVNSPASADSLSDENNSNSQEIITNNK